MSNLQLAVPKEPSRPINLIILCLVIGNTGVEPVNYGFRVHCLTSLANSQEYKAEVQLCKNTESIKIDLEIATATWANRGPRFDWLAAVRTFIHWLSLLTLSIIQD